MILYHGTTSLALCRIATCGIRPRGGNGTDNWTHTVSSNPNCVYLTKCYGLHFAMAASNNEEAAKPVIIEVDTGALNEANMQADEDALEQGMRGKDKLPPVWTMKRRTEYYRKRANRYPAEVSLQSLGTCSYNGIVPVSALRRVAIIDIKQAMQYIIRACDPTVTLLNYRFMGSQHHAFHQWLFEPSSGGYHNLTRDGLQIKSITECIEEEA